MKKNIGNYWKGIEWNTHWDERYGLNSSLFSRNFIAKNPWVFCNISRGVDLDGRTRKIHWKKIQCNSFIGFVIYLEASKVRKWMELKPLKAYINSMFCMYLSSVKFPNTKIFFFSSYGLNSSLFSRKISLKKIHGFCNISKGVDIDGRTKKFIEKKSL